MAQQPVTQIKKRLLKIVKKLPKVQVGTILNIFWTNGSFEKPANPLTKEEIDKNFIELSSKIDWSTDDVGTLTIKGKFNYLIYKGGEYFFLTPIRIVDIKKQEFTYSVVRDITMTMLCNPKYQIRGTLIKTLDESTLINNLDRTKALVEDYDESVIVSIDEDKDKIKLVRNYEIINLDNFIKVKCFSTKKLSWIIAHLCQDDVNDKFSVYLSEKNRQSPIKMFFNCEYDELIPQSKIIDFINEWLLEGNVEFGYVDDKTKAFSSYSCDVKIKEIYAKWPKIPILSKVRPQSEAIQETYLVKVKPIQGEGVEYDYLSDVNEIVPLTSDNLDVLYLNNRYIFDMLEDSTFSESYSQWDSHYELMPRVYTDLKDFLQYNNGVVSSRLKYNISIDELEKVGHLLDDKKDYTEEGESVVNDIKISYYPDFWQGKSWSVESLGNLQDSIQNSNPVVGFLLYDIYDYWKYTRGSDKTRRYFNLYTKDDPLSEIKITTGIRFYSRDDDTSRVDLIAEYGADKISLVKSEQNYINFGFVSGQECKTLKNAIDVFIRYTFLFEKDDLSCINKEFARKFGCSFIVHGKTKDWEITDYKVSSKVFDLTSGVVGREVSDVVGVNNLELLEHCWKNYNRIRDISTITSTVNLDNSIKKGDVFWSNASWCMHNKLNGNTLLLNKNVFALLFAPEDNLLGRYSVRFSHLNVIDIKPFLSSENNIILSGDNRQLDKNDLYPWLIHEKDLRLKAFHTEIQTADANALQKRRTKLKLLVDELIDKLLYYETLRVTANNEELGKWAGFSLGWLSWAAALKRPYLHTIKGYKGYEGEEISLKEFRQMLKNFIDTSIDRIIVYDFGTFPGVEYGAWTGWTYKNDLKSRKIGVSLIEPGHFTSPTRFGFYDVKGSKYIVTGGYLLEPDRRELVWFRDNANWFMEGWKERWKNCEDDYENKTYKVKSFSDTDMYGNFLTLFSPSEEGYSTFKSITEKTGYKTLFTKTGKVYGCLSLTLDKLYENTEKILLTKSKFECKWTDVSLKNIEETKNQKDKLWIFKLISRSPERGEIVKGYVLMQWSDVDKKPLMQILIGDDRAIKRKNLDIISPKKSLIVNDDLYQCINQKNFFYAYGQKIPIKGKLFVPYISKPFEIYINPISTKADVFEKYSLKIVTPLEIIDTKISVPKRELSLGRPNTSYLELERLKLDMSESDKNRSLDIASSEEKARVLREKLQNAKDELAFQQVMGPVNVIGGSLMSMARIARFAVPNPENQLQRQSNVAAGLLGLAGTWQLGSGIAQHVHNMQTGQRDIEQMDRANSFNIAHDKNMLENRHKHEEMREKLKLLELNNNYSEWSAGDDEELKNYNQLLFGNEKTNLGFIHYRPRKDGQLMRYILSYYQRYGVDLFLDNYVLNISEIINKDLTIWQFDSISNINVINNEHSEHIRKIFINGVRFKKIEYLFDDPKLTLDESYVIKGEFDEKRKIDDTKRLLIAKGEIDAVLGEQVRLAKEHLDRANAEYQRVEAENERLEARVSELENLVSAGCSQQTLDDLEKAKKDLEKCRDGASLLSEEKFGLQEKVTGLENQLALEKRKSASADQQVVNAGKANYELVKKVADSEAAKKAAEGQRDAALQEKEKVTKERDECNAAAELVRQELQSEKAELLVKIKELQDCKDEKDRIVCVEGLDEHGVFNDYVSRINALVARVENAFDNVFIVFAGINDRYTYFRSGGKYSYSDDIRAPEPLYTTDRVAIRGQGKIGNKLVSSNLTIELNKDLNYVFNGGYYTRFPITSCLRGGFVNESGYQGFWINTKSGDVNFFSSTIPHRMLYHMGNYVCLYGEYIKLAKEFKRWNGKTDYLNRNNIKITPLNLWDNSPYQRVKDEGFIKELYFNERGVSWSI